MAEVPLRRNRDFMLLQAGQLLSTAGTQTSSIAYPLLVFSPVQPDGLGAQTGKPTDNDVWLAIGLGAALAFLL